MSNLYEDKMLDYAERIARALETMAEKLVDRRPLPEPERKPQASVSVPDGGWKCPTCQAQMILRTARADGQQFWGCTRYPECKQTRRLDGSVVKRYDNQSKANDR